MAEKGERAVSQYELGNRRRTVIILGLTTLTLLGIGVAGSFIGVDVKAHLLSDASLVGSGLALVESSSQLGDYIDARRIYRSTQDETSVDPETLEIPIETDHPEE